MKAKMVRSGRRLVILAAAALAILPSGAAVYLRADAPEEYGDGRSWSSAVRTVAAAFRLLASEPDTQADRTLYVARGVYSTSGLSSDKTTTNQFASIAVYGGYKGEVDGDMTRDPAEYQTVFSAVEKPERLVWYRCEPKLGTYSETVSSTVLTNVVAEGKVVLPPLVAPFDALATGGGYGGNDQHFLTVTAGGEGAVVSGIAFVAYGRGSPNTILVEAGSGCVMIEDCAFVAGMPQIGCVRFVAGEQNAASCVRNCLFFGNNPKYSNSCCLEVTPQVRVEGCRFVANRKNEGYYASALVRGTAACVTNCLFTHNYALATNSNGSRGLIGDGKGLWTDCVITNNLAASMGRESEGSVPMPLLSLGGCLRRSLVAGNRVEVTAADGLTYGFVGRFEARDNESSSTTYEGCLFASNVLATAAVTADAGGTYALGLVCGRLSASHARTSVVRGCTFEGNALETVPAEGVKPTLCRGVLVAGETGETASDAAAFVTNCTFIGGAVAGVADIVQCGLSRQTSSVCDSIFSVTGADVHERPFAASDPARFSVRNCSIKNLQPAFYPANLDVTDGLCSDPIPFDRIQFRVAGQDTGWTLPRPAARVPGIRATTGGTVRGAVNALAPVAETGATLVVRREPFLGGTVDRPVQAVPLGTAIAPVTATPAPGVTVLGWYEGETALSGSDVLALDALDADRIVTVRFRMPQVTVTFDLGVAGVFGDGASVTNLSCDVGGAFPEMPACRLDPAYHVYAWDERPPLVPGTDVTIRAYAVTKALRHLYVTPDGTGDGSSWEAASGDLAAAYADAARYRGELHLGPGTFRVTAPIPLLSNVSVIGDPSGGTVLDGASGSGYAYSAFASAANGVTNVAFRELTFHDFGRAAISLTGESGDRVVVSNCVFDACNRSQTLSFYDYSALAVWHRPLVCVGCRFINCWRAVLHRSTANTTNLFASCTFAGNSDGSLALFSEAGGATLVTNCLFTGNSGTKYDAGSSLYPLGPCLMYRNTGSQRLDVVDSGFVGTSMSGDAYPPICLMGESAADICLARCRLTDNAYSGNGNFSVRAGVFWLACKQKVITIRDCFVARNSATAPKKSVVSVMALEEHQSMAVNLLNCTFEENEATTKDGQYAGTVLNNSYSAIGVAHCTFAGNTFSGGTCADIVNIDNWNSEIKAVNSVFWSEAAGYKPLTGFGTSPAAFGSCVIRNYDGIDFGEKPPVLFGQGVWTDDPVLRAASAAGPNGVWARRLAGCSPFVRRGFDDVWFCDNRIWVHSGTVTGKEWRPWLALSSKTSQSSATPPAGLTLASPRTRDAWGRLRRPRRLSLGPVNVDLGLTLIVK